MKKTFTLFTFLMLIVCGKNFAQSALTFTQNNFGKIGTYNQNFTTSLSTVKFAGANYLLNYDTAMLTSNGALMYTTATDAFFTPHCDAYFAGTTVSKNFYYNTNFYYTTNANEYSENGIHIPAQGYSETAVTGGANDSIIFPDQKYILNQSRTIVKFPATIGYRNFSDSKRTAQFNINVAAYSLNHTPAWHVSDIYRQDTILGWGKMRIYTAAGPSIYYDVLSMLSVQYSIDSFFLGTRYTVAPAPLTAAFGVSQGQHVNDKNRIYYFRANRAAPLMLVTLDSAMTGFTGIYFDADNITTATGIEGVGKKNYSTFIFPNPSAGKFNIQFIGKDLSEVNYSILDVSGKTMQIGTNVKMNNNALEIKLDEHLTNGMYFIHLTNLSNESIATEEFNLVR